ncbi:DNA-directed RNA polymerase I subunit RPA12-like isoform X2 [Penaeus chinensis]|nr:DNA-directed RNA polymerase I subunit RPA12-like isoform X2 [Penaeus chinensis]XP_047501641.1 DNA-directed RNA polymerase I subunit RPA12-like isoform X2 [Penaeus chinensis]XP_047501642.1 DNA-directed RNA polymerase I subunit RPA12-like isoform X2 [Penaeus chinensis]
MDMKEMDASLKAIFKADPDFCPACGAILALPKSGMTVTCKVCKYSICFSDLIGQETTYHFDFVPMGTYLTQSIVEEEEDELGQMDSGRECSKCGNVGMSYTTMQLRSADEGQTIFYICPKCKHREVENS